MPERKLLVHGGEIIRSFLVARGQLSRQVLDATRKDIERFRENNTRKLPTSTNIKDLFRMLCITLTL